MLPSMANGLHRFAQIEDLEMDRSSWVIQVSPKLYKCPYKRKAEGGLKHRGTQRSNVKVEADSGVMYL